MCIYVSNVYSEMDDDDQYNVIISLSHACSFSLCSGLHLTLYSFSLFVPQAVPVDRKVKLSLGLLLIYLGKYMNCTTFNTILLYSYDGNSTYPHPHL